MKYWDARKRKLIDDRVRQAALAAQLKDAAPTKKRSKEDISKLRKQVHVHTIAPAVVGRNARVRGGGRGGTISSAPAVLVWAAVSFSEKDFRRPR